MVLGGGYSVGALAADAITGATCTKYLAMAANGVRAWGASKRLRASLSAVGQIARIGDEAHHIVAAGARGAEQARDLLAAFGIGIDDAANGVFLPNKVHRKIHTAEYYKSVTERLSQATNKDEAMEILSKIRRELEEQATKATTNAKPQ